MVVLSLVSRLDQRPVQNHWYIVIEKNETPQPTMQMIYYERNLGYHYASAEPQACLLHVDAVIHA